MSDKKIVHTKLDKILKCIQVMKAQISNLKESVQDINKQNDVWGRQRFLARFVSGPYNRLKNLTAAVNATRSATRILLRGGDLKKS